MTLAQDLAAVVRSLGHERAVIVGAGLGGQVAWALPSLAPDLTTAIFRTGGHLIVGHGRQVEDTILRFIDKHAD